MDVVRKKLTPDEIAPPNLRYNPDCDCVQITANGTDWVNNPQADPRTGTYYLLPPNSTPSDPKCAAANGINNFFRSSLTILLDQLSAGVNLWGAVSVVLNILDFLEGIGLLIQLILDFVSAVIGIGVTDIEESFDDTAYAALLCIFFCNCGSDGSISASQFASIQSQIASQFGALSIVNIVMQGWLSNVGYVGLNNIASLKATDGDCSACDMCEWTYEWDFTVSDGDFYDPIRDTPTMWESGQGWVGQDGAGFTAATIVTHAQCGGDCHVVVQWFEADVDFGSVSPSAAVAFWYLTSTSTFNLIGYGSLSPSTGLHTYHYDDTSGTEYPNVGVNCLVNASGQSVKIERFRVHGVGALPAFTGGSFI
jgi:hypothetical protein